jgi:molybdate transport system substrate-binding protein
MKRLCLVVAGFLFVAGCSSPTTEGPQQQTTDLTVFAASSLTAAFTQLGTDFERIHTGVKVVFNFGSSTDLANQISSEGTADVFASASSSAMDTVAAEPGLSDRADFATNHLVIITPPDNPAHVVSLDSLTSPMALVVGAEGVPVGDYTRQMLDAQGLEHAVLTNVVSNEPDDASIVAKVESGDADAGIVYTSDIPIIVGKVHIIEIPPRINITATYPIAVVSGSENPADAHAFVQFVLGNHGQVVLDSHGFEPAPG